jgi:5'-methylthioadenosine phosphorylase
VLGLITGSGFYDPADLTARSTTEIATPYGPVAVTTGSWSDRPVVFLPRHGADHSVPPHAIDYRANVWALAHAGATAIVATAVSGGINPAMGPGTLVLISDFIDFTSGRASTFFDGMTDPRLRGRGTKVTHTDMTRPYDPDLRDLLRRAAELESIPVVDGGTYCTTNGPRFESPAEIKMMATLGGDLVGMTGYPEVALAREAGLPYASVGVISNWAAGLSEAELSVDDIMGVIEGAGDHLYRLISRTIESYGAGPAS